MFTVRSGGRKMSKHKIVGEFSGDSRSLFRFRPKNRAITRGHPQFAFYSGRKKKQLTASLTYASRFRLLLVDPRGFAMRPSMIGPSRTALLVQTHSARKIQIRKRGRLVTRNLGHPHSRTVIGR